MNQLGKKSAAIVLTLSVSLVLALSACGKSNNNEGASSPSASASPSASTPASPGASPSESAGATADGKGKKVGMVTDTGGVNDKSFNQSAWEALQKLATDTGAETKYIESKDVAEFQPNLNQFIKNGYDLTWGIGFLIADAAKAAADQNPDARIAVIDTTVDAPNVESVTFKEHEGSFLVGVVAGMMTKTNKIGFVGGIDSPLIKKFEIGFKAGVAAVNKDAVVTANYVGDFSKPDLGKLAAATLYDAGNDIIFHAAGASGNGVFSEATDRLKAGKKVWVIGVDKDQSIEFGNDVTLTSMVKKVDQAVYTVSEDVLKGDFHGGLDNAQELGLTEGGVGLPDNNPNVPQDVLDKVEEFKQKIVSGELQVPAQ